MFLHAKMQNIWIRLDILKGKGKKQKGEADAEGSLKKPQVGSLSATTQTETNIPANTFPMPPPKL